MQEHRKLLSQIATRLSVSGRRLVPDHRSSLEQLTVRVRSLGNKLVAERQRRLGELARTLNAVSPLPTLDRGYAILADGDGEALLTSVFGVQEGQSMSAQLADGRIYATVDNVTGERLSKSKVPE